MKQHIVRHSKILAISDIEILEFECAEDAAVAYDIGVAKLYSLIQTGQLHRDGRTTFDYLEENQIKKPEERYGNGKNVQALDTRRER